MDAPLAMRWDIGDVTVTRVVETVIPAAARGMIRDATPEALDPHRSWLQPDFLDADDRLLLSVHALVVISAGRRIVVDTCVGEGKAAPLPGWSVAGTGFLDRLDAAGFAPASIDTVLCTHLHFDHVGWNTILVDGRWVPTFPNARYLFGRQEWEHWRGADGPAAAAAAAAAAATASLDESVRPVFDAGLVELVESDHRITDEVWLEPTPGHTPGHHSVHIASRGVEAVITGDMVHSPVQFAHPGWHSVADVDAVQAAATREAFVGRYAGEPVLVIGTHFAGPSAGRIEGSAGDRWFRAAPGERLGG